MKAIIMAGGKGSRLRPLSSHIPKPMVPLLDRPVMAYTIDLLKKHGITDIAVTIQYLPDVIRNYFGDGSDFGVHLHYFEEDKPLGTAGSVKNAESFLDETFIVISGDGLTDFNLSQAIAYHQEKKAIGTLLLHRVENPLQFGVVMTDPTGRIIRFLEKPSWGEVFSDTVNTGIYIMEPDIFNYYEGGKSFDFSQHLFPLLMASHEDLYGFIAEGYWSDIGNLAQYRQTQFDMLDNKVNIPIQGKEIAPKVWVSEKARYHNNIRIKGPTYIGDHSVLGENVWIGPYSVIGEGTTIQHDSYLTRTILWKNNYIDANIEMQGASLCGSVIVHKSTVIREGVVIGEGCEIGEKSIIHHDVKIYPYKKVEPSTTLHHSLIWDEHFSKHYFGKYGIMGKANLQLTTEFTNRLGLAYAANLTEESIVSIGHDGSEFAKILMNSFVSALHASGIHTCYFGKVSFPVSRYGTYRFPLAGGVYFLHSGKNDEEQYIIEFLDETGIPISKSSERAIENSMERENFRILSVDRIGHNTNCFKAIAYYYQDLLRLIDDDLIRKRRFRIVVHDRSMHHYRNKQKLFNTLGVEVVTVNDRLETETDFKNAIIAHAADFAIQLEENQEQIILITDQGDVLQDEGLSVLRMMIQLQFKEPTLHIPINVPDVIHETGMLLDSQIKRTKTDSRSVMADINKEGFHLYYDGMFTLLQLMQILAEQNKSLSEYLFELPEVSISKQTVACPLKEKGKVMRFLMEETIDERVELIDGIKILKHNGWTLILPDSDEPIFQIYAAAENTNDADALLQMYTEKIRRFQQLSHS